LGGVKLFYFVENVTIRDFEICLPDVSPGLSLRLCSIAKSTPAFLAREQASMTPASKTDSMFSSSRSIEAIL
jgi:hypothetical protein